MALEFIAKNGLISKGDITSSGSVVATGSITASLGFSGNFFGSHFGTSSNSVSSSFATNTLSATSASFASRSLTASTAAGLVGNPSIQVNTISLGTGVPLYDDENSGGVLGVPNLRLYFQSGNETVLAGLSEEGFVFRVDENSGIGTVPITVSSSLNSISASWSSSSFSATSSSFASRSLVAHSSSWASSSFSATSASFASRSLVAHSSSFASSSFSATSASWASSSTSASYLFGPHTGSTFGTSSWATSSSFAISASRALTASVAVGLIGNPNIQVNTISLGTGVLLYDVENAGGTLGVHSLLASSLATDSPEVVIAQEDGLLVKASDVGTITIPELSVHNLTVNTIATINSPTTFNGTTQFNEVLQANYAIVTPTIWDAYATDAINITDRLLVDDGFTSILNWNTKETLVPWTFQDNVQFDGNITVTGNVSSSGFLGTASFASTASHAIGTQFDITDPTNFFIHEEFCAGSTPAGQIGSLGWWHNSSGQQRAATSTFPNFGVFEFTSAATSGSEASCFFPYNGASGAQIFSNLPTQVWKATFVFKLPDITNVFARVGFVDGPSINTFVASSYRGYFLRYDTTVDTGTGKFRFVCRNQLTGIQTVTTSTISADTNFHTLRIRSSGTNIIYFSLDGETEVAISSNIHAFTTTPLFNVLANAAEAKKIWADFFSMSGRGLTR